MKLIPLFLLGSLVVGQAAVYTMNLGGAASQSPADGLDGWAQSEPNYVDEISGEVYPRAFVHQIGSSSALAVGGYYDSFAPTSGSSITLARDLDLLGINYSTLSLDFTIQDSITRYSDGVDADVDRNQFSIGFFSASGDELVNLIFRPNSQSADPGGSTAATWNTYVSSGGVQIGDAFGAVFEGDPVSGGVYSLSLITVLSASTGDVDFSISVSSLSSSSVQNVSGSLLGLAGQPIDALRFGWEEAGNEVDGLGSNFIAFNNVVVSVPEPSGALLCLVSALPFVLRRKRGHL